MKHLIITPVHNEEKHLDRFIASVLNQTMRPDIFILVDDNSSDLSGKIINNYSNKYPWIKYLYHKSETKRDQGAKVIRAFNYGIKNFDYTNFDIISKIDADLELPNDYFEEILNTFINSEKTGVCGGIINENENGNWVVKNVASYHIRGALKSYRVKCFQDIGGLQPILGWDGLDEMKSMFLGWGTFTIKKNVKHFRPASKDFNKIKLNYNLGYVNYINGGNLSLAIIRTIVRFFVTPIFIGALSFLVGYLHALIRNENKVTTKQFAQFINKFHTKRLMNLNRY
jgi:glycosyltransferase involved in cell wall biosynthesis